MPRDKRENPATRTVAGAALMFVNLALKAGANFLLIPLSLKVLGNEDFALWILLQSFVLYLSLSEMGLGQTIMNFGGAAYANGEMRTFNSIVFNGFFLYWMLILPVLLIAVLTAGTQPVGRWLLTGASAESMLLFNRYLIVLSVLALLRIPFTVFPAALSALRELPLRQAYEAINPIFLFISTALVLLWGGRIWSLIIVTGVGTLLVSMGSYFLLMRRHADVRLSRTFWAPGMLRALFSNSVFFFFIGLAYLVQRTAGNLLIGKYVSIQAVPSIYALVTIFRVFGWSIVDILSRSLQPYVVMWGALQQQNQIVLVARLITKVTVAAGSLLVALIWFYRDQFFGAWLGPAYVVPRAVFICIASAFLIDTWFLPTVNVLIGLNRHKTVALALMCESVLTVVLGIAGSVWFRDNAMFGISLGFFLAAIAGQLCLMPILAITEFRVSIRQYLSGFVFRAGLSPTGLFAVGMIAQPGSNVGKAIFGGLALVVVGIASLAVAITAEEWSWLRSVATRPYSMETRAVTANHLDNSSA